MKKIHKKNIYNEKKKLNKINNYPIVRKCISVKWNNWLSDKRRMVGKFKCVITAIIQGLKEEYLGP